MKPLKEKFKELGATYSEIADVVGLTKQAVGNWVSENSIPSHAVKKICRHYKVSADWLLELTNEKTEYYTKVKLIDTEKSIIKVNDLYEYAVVDWVDVNKDLYNMDLNSDIDAIYKTSYKGNCFAVIINSDEMQPTLEVGDNALIDIDAEINTGDFVLIKLSENVSAIRQYVKTGLETYIKKTNRDYPNQVEPLTDNMEVIGKVVQKMKIQNL